MLEIIGLSKHFDGVMAVTEVSCAIAKGAITGLIGPNGAGKRKYDAGDLSGGEKQMLALGRALMMRPKLLLLDEPSLGLAPLALKKSLETIRGIRDSYQTAMFIVEQNVDAVFAIADRVYVMALGKVVAEDSPVNLHRERLRELFLGKQATVLTNIK